MSLTVADFNLSFPEFRDVKDPIINRHLSLSIKLLDSGNWGDFIDDAVGLMTAHELALAGYVTSGGERGGIAASHGPISSASVNGMSTSFANMTTRNPSEDYYARTSYGQSYLNLRKRCLPMGTLSI